MMSAEDIAAVKVAIEVCNNPKLKREILCIPGSEYSEYRKKNIEYRRVKIKLQEVLNKTDLTEGSNCEEGCRKEIWDKIIEKKADIIVRNLEIEEKMQEKIIGTVLSVGMQMLTWVKYHEITIGISSEYSVNFLKNCFFTQRGIIDNKKAAEELMKDQSLSSKQKYKLACIYCFTDQIAALYRQMTEQEKKEFYDDTFSFLIVQPELVKFWSYYLMGEVDKVKGDKTTEEYRLEKAVESGSREAVKYCLEARNLSRNGYILLYTAVKAVRMLYFTDTDWSLSNDKFIIFEEGKKANASWVPSNYYIEIIFFLVTKMVKEQQIDFFRICMKEEEDAIKSDYDKRVGSKALEYFLEWPYQDHFMKIADLMWEFLPTRNYAILLLKISDKLETKYGTFDYGAEKTYDYRLLLKEFWCRSPKSDKRRVLSNMEVSYKMSEEVKSATKLLLNLLTLKGFNDKDKEIVELILAEATDIDKENILYSNEWKNKCIDLISEENWQTLNTFLLCFDLSKEKICKFQKELCFTNKVKSIFLDLLKDDCETLERTLLKLNLSNIDIEKYKKELILFERAESICIDLMKNEEWKVLDTFLQNSTLSNEEKQKFKRKLSFTSGAKSLCINFAKCNNWNAADSFIKWIALPEDEINRLKSEMVHSKFGRDALSEVILNTEDVKVIEEFVRWHFISGKEVKDFKKEFFLSYYGSSICKKLTLIDKFELVHQLFEGCLSLEDKKTFAYKTGYQICQRLISDYSLGFGSYKSEFEGGKWLQVEKFVTWCFSTEEEISEFKRAFFLDSGLTIHETLIKFCEWEVAEAFFAWVDLSAEEIKQLKKDTFFNRGGFKFFKELIFYEDEEEIAHYGSKLEALQLLLRWYFTDKETILELKNAIEEEYSKEEIEDYQDTFEKLDLMIEQRLKDLDEDLKGTKRKCEAS